MKVNHYQWLDKHFFGFLEALGVSPEPYRGIVVAHGDKCYQYDSIFKRHGVPFPHGVAIYFLTYVRPYADEVRQQADGSWVNFEDWFAANKDRFLPLLPAIDKTDPDVLSHFGFGSD